DACCCNPTRGQYMPRASGPPRLRSASLIALAVCLLITMPANKAVIFVKSTASGSNDGTSWNNAYTSLISAITATASGDEIWVAAATYKPTATTDRTIAFTLKSGVAIYNSFNGNKTNRAD